MKYIRIYADQNGDSHFEDVEVGMSLTNFAPPAPPVDVSPLMSSTNVGFLGFPGGWYGPPHPAPRRQFLFVLSGEAEVTVSDGEVRHVAPGSIALLEDTSGKGHATRIVGNEYGIVVLATWDICSQNRRAEPVQWLSSAILLLRKDTLSGNSRTGKLMLNEHICIYSSTKQRGNIFSSSVEGNAKTPSHVDTTILFLCWLLGISVQKNEDQIWL